MSDTSEIINGCLSHYDSRHIQVRKDFFDICAYDPGEFNRRCNEKGKTVYDEPDQECMAKILRILETLTDARRTQWYLESKRAIEQGLTPPSEPKEYPIPLTYSAIYELLYGTHGDNTIRNSVAALRQWNYIKWYQEASNSIPYLTLNTEVIQTRFKQQAEQALAGVEFNSQASRASKVLNSKRRVLNLTARRPNSTPTLPEFNSQGAEFNTNNNSNNNKNLEENNKKESVARATPARTLSSQDTSSHQGDDDEIPHADLRPAVAEPVVPATDAQASVVCTGRVAAVPEREESAGHLRRTEISLAKGDTDATSTLPDPDPLPAAEAFRNHVHRVEDRRVPVQAEAKRSRDEQTPFPVTSPQNGAVGSGTGTSGPRASGRRGKPQQQDVIQATLPPAPKFHLTEAEEQFWGLWCQVWFNKDIPPDLNDTAYKHVVKLAPHIKTAEQLDSLIKRAKKDLEDAQGLKRKTVFLGNLVTSYSGWKQEQKPPEQPKPKQEAPMQPLPVLRVLPPDRSKSPRLRSASQTVGRA